MANLPRGVLVADHVEVRDTAEANRLHNKTLCGEPQPGNWVRLTIVEASWLVAENRLEATGPHGPVSASDLLAAGGAGCEVDALCYGDLRTRGLAVKVRSGGDGFDVLPRGGATEPGYRIHVRSERDPIVAADLWSWAKNDAVVAIVDEDGAVTHYRLAVEDPNGSCPAGRLPAATGRILADRVAVEDPVAAEAYHTREFLGTPIGATLVLSFTEAEALRQRGILSAPSDLRERAARVQTHFLSTLPVYQDLRERGVVAKSGFRFGTHLRGYPGNPDDGHAEWLIHCIADGAHWSELSRGVRLAHGVRKKFLVAGGEPVQYLNVAWFKP